MAYVFGSFLVERRMKSPFASFMADFGGLSKPHTSHRKSSPHAYILEL